jgi:hypothetical protein
VFPNGKTLHVPSDGKPLPGFETALASYESRKKNGTTALALASSPSKSSKSGGLLSALFGGGADEEEDNGEGVVVASAPAAETQKPSSDIRIVPPELANPVSAGIPLEEAVDETPETIIAALPLRDIPLPAFAPRPQVDVGAVNAGEMALAAATPDSIPFGMAAEVLPENGGEEIGEEADAAIPLPTWRPDDEEDASETSLVALAAPEPGLSEVGLAALNSSEAMSIGDEIEAEVQENNQRLAILSQPAGLKEAVDTLAKGSRPVAGGVKTTQKAARARVGDTKPAPKPLVVAAQPEAARWALDVDTELAYAAGGPSIEHLSSVPSEVYATGFQRNTVVADAGRFSGKAITFMPVARFQTN